jgi:membrane-associated protein
MPELKEIVAAIGYIGVFSIIFAESGLLIGFFLPGDSLLFTAGFLASQGFFDIHMLVLGCFIAAVGGDSIGYFIGKKWGRKLFNKKDSMLFRHDHLMTAENFYEKHGGKTVILARFIPVIRAFAPVVAGIGKMNYITFLAYDIVGGLLWAVAIPYLGYYLGRSIPDIDKYLLPAVGLIVILSISPSLFHALKTKDRRDKTLLTIKNIFSSSKK